MSNEELNSEEPIKEEELLLEENSPIEQLEAPMDNSEELVVSPDKISVKEDKVQDKQKKKKQPNKDIATIDMSSKLAQDFLNTSEMPRSTSIQDLEDVKVKKDNTDFNNYLM